MFFRNGFTLIEVLVTLVMLSFGLLGIAKLMIQGQRAAFEAYQRHQAITIASNMAERIRANSQQSVAYLIAPGAPVGNGSQFTSCPIDCTTSTCSNAELATFDIAKWDGLIAGVAQTRGAGLVLPQGCVEQVQPNHLRVSIAWQGNIDTVAPPDNLAANGSACGTSPLPYGSPTKRRLVTLDVILCQGCAP